MLRELRSADNDKEARVSRSLKTIASNATRENNRLDSDTGVAVLPQARPDQSATKDPGAG